MRNTILTQQVNFVVSVFFIGSAALLACVLILNAAEMDNPIADHLVAFAAEVEQ